MNIEKWTVAMQEALQRAMTRTMSMSRQVVDIEDMLLALLDDSSGILYRVLLKADVNMNQLRTDLEKSSEGKPVVNGVDESQISLLRMI